VRLRQQLTLESLKFPVIQEDRSGLDLIPYAVKYVPQVWVTQSILIKI
jgi:hypothetical protein